LTLRRDLTRLALALGMTLGLLTLAAQARGDDPPVPITVGGADWGLKESFRNYIEGSIAHGTITVADGASRNPDGSFHFPLASGSYDPTTKSTFARFGGSVHFSGHDGQLELDVSDVAVEITPSGATAFADVTSKSLSDGKSVDFPNVELAALDLAGVDPVDNAGTTEWSTIPAQLTEAGAPAFSGFYSPGQELDPFSFAYEGPGGKPTPEVWAAPGTPGYDQLAAEVNPGASKALFVDRVRGVVHVAAGNGVRALDLETLALKGAKASAVTLGANEYAFDAETGTVFAVQDATASNPIRAFTWDAGAGTYSEASLPISGTKTTHLAYEPSDDTLFAIEGGAATPDTSTLTPAVNTAVRDGSGWVAAAYPALSTGGRAISDILRTGPGKFVATQHAYYVGTQTPTTIFPSGAIELTDTGSALTVTPIAGTTPPPPASGFTFGYAEPALGPGASVVLREFQGLAPVAHMLRLVPGSSGYTAGTTTDLGASSNAVIIDDTTGSGYVLKPSLDKVEVMEGDAVVGTITEPPTGVAGFKPTFAAASDGTFYFHNNVAPTKVFAYRHSGDSPTITAEPEDASVVLVGDSDTAPVSFTAAASADPAPAVRWQQRPLGSVIWTDMPGAEEPTLSLTASAASAGDRYRAVFSNSAGEIATRVATLAVKVEAAPPTGEPPAGETPAPPAQQPPAAPPAQLPAGTKPKLQLGFAHLVKPNGVAALARVQCPGELICQLQAPKRAKLKIAGKSYWGQVVAPKALMAGGSAVVKVKLPPPAREALTGGKGWATLRLVVSSGEERLIQKLVVKIQGGN
jgi:hypothetical protein